MRLSSHVELQIAFVRFISSVLRSVWLHRITRCNNLVVLDTALKMHGGDVGGIMIFDC